MSGQEPGRPRPLREWLAAAEEALGAQPELSEGAFRASAFAEILEVVEALRCDVDREDTPPPPA